MNQRDFLDLVADRNPGESEFLQAVSEVAESVWPLIDGDAVLQKAKVFERLTEPDRLISFRVVWEMDDGTIAVNRGYRVQFSSALGPYKGGLRFHPSVNPSILKFLGFEQNLKNALTGLPMGGGKGGADFNPAGRSDAEIMRFCHAFMRELYRHIGPDVDIPAGDIGVGAREIGYLFGAYKSITNSFGAALTGKRPAFGGSEMRTEATGYGLAYFVCRMLEEASLSFDGLRVAISGAGNVALYAADKVLSLGGTVITVSDSKGTLHKDAGFSEDDIAAIRDQKSSGASLGDIDGGVGGDWHADSTPWSIECDVALPCATQNELDGEAAKTLIKNGVKAVGEGANMPSTADAIHRFREADILFAPGKAANAGGVALSGLEISQNQMRQYRSREDLAENLKSIMNTIHQSCLEASMEAGHGRDYAHGANIAGFKKLAAAITAFGPI